MRKSDIKTLKLLSKMKETQTNNEKYQSKRITLDNHLHARPSISLVDIANDYFTNYDCRIYVHKKGMGDINFLDTGIIDYEGKPYFDVRSIIYMMALEGRTGDELEFIASGEQKHAKRALDEIEIFSKSFE